MRHVHRQALFTVVALVVFFSGCRWLRGQMPAVTDSGGGADGGQVLSPSVGFGAARAILRRACAETCHDGRTNAADDVVFKDDGDLYGRLLEAAPRTVPPACQNRPLILPGYPERSLLFAMIGASDEPRAGCAERMPHSCPEKRPCLSPDEIQSIRAWIEAGAPP